MYIFSLVTHIRPGKRKHHRRSFALFSMFNPGYWGIGIPMRRSRSRNSWNNSSYNNRNNLYSWYGMQRFGSSNGGIYLRKISRIREKKVLN